jgi:hypothetical protein
MRSVRFLRQNFQDKFYSDTSEYKGQELSSFNEISSVNKITSAVVKVQFGCQETL